jgi:hypothetical protein
MEMPLAALWLARAPELPDPRQPDDAGPEDRLLQGGCC